MIKKIYSKFIKHRQSEMQRIVRREVAINAIKQNAYVNSNSIINNEISNNIIVSLTTFGIRINYVYLAIESIAMQTIKPDKIILWLSEKDFNDSNLPITLIRLMKRGLEIRYCKDIGPHTKLIYALKEFPDSNIITIDDDIIYPIDLIENLYKTYLEFPQHICCNVARLITKKDTGSFLPYNNWNKLSTNKKASKNFMPLGVNGVLYPPKSFDDLVFNEKLIKMLSPNADDIWFKIMSLIKKTNVVLTGCYPDFENYFIPLDSSFINALAEHNVINNMNDNQFQASMDYFKIDL